MDLLQVKNLVTVTDGDFAQAETSTAQILGAPCLILILPCRAPGQPPAPQLETCGPAEGCQALLRVQ